MTVNYERAVSRRYLTVRVIAISRLRDFTRNATRRRHPIPTHTQFVTVGDRIMCMHGVEFVANRKGERKEGRDKKKKKKREEGAQGWPKS